MVCLLANQANSSLFRQQTSFRANIKQASFARSFGPAADKLPIASGKQEGFPARFSARQARSPTQASAMNHGSCVAGSSYEQLSLRHSVARSWSSRRHELDVRAQFICNASASGQVGCILSAKVVGVVRAAGRSA
jgi:hypothetical protein